MDIHRRSKEEEREQQLKLLTEAISISLFYRERRVILWIYKLYYTDEAAKALPGWQLLE